MNGLQTFAHPYLGIYTKCYLWQTESYNVWIDTGLRPNWWEMEPRLTNGRKNVLLLTHGHWDHIGGVELIRRHGGTVYAHPADRKHLTDLEWHWELLFGQFEQDFDLPPARKPTFWESVEQSDLDEPVSDGDILSFDHLRFRVTEIPGHSGGSVCYLEETTGTLFTGDGIMGNGFFSGTPQIENFSQYLRSMDKLKSLSVSTVLTDHTEPVSGEDFPSLLLESQSCANRMLAAVRSYVDTAADISVGGAAKAIACAEGKNVGGGTCVSALAGCTFVFEAVKEDVTVKRQVYANICRFAADNAIIASTTSSLDAEILAALTEKPNQLIIAHPFQPAHLQPLVEVVRHQKTDEAVVERTCALLDSLGRQVVRLERSVPGFLVNRFAQALFRESIYLIEQGVTSAADIDLAVKYAVGMRYASIGLLEYFDDVGFELESAIAQNVYPDLCGTTALQNTVLDGLADGRTGLRAGRGLYNWENKDIPDYQRRKQAPFYKIAETWNLPT